jgi:microcystin-dependent protein
MASTYTTNLRLTKQGDGENPNSWGQILNDGVISLVDDAIAGYTTVSLGSAATVTLTNVQGAGDQARSAILEFKGTVGGSNDNIVVLVPNNSKSYVIKNSVSYNDSTDSVVVKVAGNTGVTVSPEETALYVTNGTTVYPVSRTTYTNLTATSITATVLTATSIATSILDASAITLTGNVTAANAVISDKVCASAYFGSGINLTEIVPSGSIFPYGAASAPTGYLLCYGQAISRTTYSGLFSAIGTTYGTGDGSSTFNLPDLRGRVVAGQDDMGGSSADRLTGQSGGVDGDTLGGTGGAETHTLSAGELAAHTHTYEAGNTSGTNIQPGNGISANNGNDRQTDQNDPSGGAHNNVQPTIILNYIIKT